MSKYVMSDLHGEYNRFFKMLKLIVVLVSLKTKDVVWVV